MFSTNISSIKDVELIKNQKIEIIKHSEKSLQIRPLQTHGTPGILLSEKIPLNKNNLYQFDIYCKHFDQTRTFLWLGNQQHQTVNHYDLRNGKNTITLNPEKIAEELVKVGIFFKSPSIRDNLILNSLKVDVKKTTPQLTCKKNKIVYHARNFIKLSNSYISDVLDNSTHISNGFNYFEQSPVKKRIDYYISDQQLQDKLRMLQQLPNLPI